MLERLREQLRAGAARDEDTLTHIIRAGVPKT